MRVFLLLLLLLPSPVFALSPDEMLKDSLLEARAREISRELRCVVCQGQSVEDSPSEIAADVRRLVRARLAAGDTDAEVFSRLQARYGDYILMRPPVKRTTLLLWFMPLIVLLAGAAALFRAALGGKGGA